MILDDRERMRRMARLAGEIYAVADVPYGSLTRAELVTQLEKIRALAEEQQKVVWA